MKQTFKRLTAIFAAAALAVTCLPLTAIAETLPQEEILAAGDTGEYGDFTYQELEDGTLAITGYSGWDTELVIPSEIDGKKVTVIGGSVFWHTNIIKITVPDSVTTIENSAFYGCERLTEINLPNSLTKLGNYAFDNCDALTEIILPDKLTTIGEGAFFSCDALMEITIPDSVTTIGDSAFQSCDSLTAINVGENNKNYSSVGGVLYNKDTTTLIQFPCGKADAPYAVPDGVTTIEREAFSDCDLLTKITLPDSLTTIGYSAFSKCSSLTEINLPNSITTIDTDTFSGCSSLKKITLPDGMTTTASKMFYECSSLTEINFPDGLTAIGNETFAYCTSLSKIDLPDSLTSIWNGAFNGCSSLTEVILPDSLTSIWKNAFNRCTSLTQITIPANVEIICFGPPLPENWGSAFNGCESLTEINVDENNQYFCSIDGVLYNKDVTTLVQFPCGKDVTSYVIPDSVTTIFEEALSSCTSLTEITLPYNLTLIMKSAFSNCSSLTEITIPDGVTTIREEAFNSCDSLAEVNLPDSVKTIGRAAFQSCYSLTEITIPASVTNIGQDAFAYVSDDFTIYGYTGSYAETYAKENEIPFVSIGLFLNSESDVYITADEGVIPTGAQLGVEQTEKTNTSVSYNITLTQDGKEIQPDGKVTVRIPVPEGWSDSTIHAYRKDADGTLTDMNAVVSGGYVVFTTDHFSEYIIEREIALPGDVNGDGEVGELDSVELARYLANWNVTIDKDAADLDGDGEVGETDSVILARRLAGWNV